MKNEQSSVDTSWLGWVLFFVMLHGCETADRVKKLEKEVERLSVQATDR